MKTLEIIIVITIAAGFWLGMWSTFFSWVFREKSKKYKGKVKFMVNGEVQRGEGTFIYNPNPSTKGSKL